MFFCEEEYGRINGGTRVLELVADSWEAALGHGARSLSPTVSFKSPMGARPEATRDGGGSEPKERHGLAATVLRDHPPPENPGTGGLWGHIPVPTIF
jgi:hypothetical protein